MVEDAPAAGDSALAWERNATGEVRSDDNVCWFMSEGSRSWSRNLPAGTVCAVQFTSRSMRSRYRRACATVRACRRHTSSVVAAFVTYPKNAVRWSEAEPTRYRSSPPVIRSFCGRCGSPLAYENDHPPRRSTSISARLTMIRPAFRRNSILSSANGWLGSIRSTIPRAARLALVRMKCHRPLSSGHPPKSRRFLQGKSRQSLALGPDQVPGSSVFPFTLHSVLRRSDVVEVASCLSSILRGSWFEPTPCGLSDCELAPAPTCPAPVPLVSIGVPMATFLKVLQTGPKEPAWSIARAPVPSARSLAYTATMATPTCSTRWRSCGRTRRSLPIASQDACQKCLSGSTSSAGRSHRKSAPSDRGRPWTFSSK